MVEHFLLLTLMLDAKMLEGFIKKVTRKNVFVIIAVTLAEIFRKIQKSIEKIEKT